MGGELVSCEPERGWLVEKGRDIVLFPGVEDWFSRINAFGLRQGVDVEH